MKRWLYPIGLFWAQLLLTAFVYQKLPRSFAIMQLGSFLVLFGTPAITLVGLGLSRLFVKQTTLGKSDQLALNWIVTFFFAVHALVLGTALGLLSSLGQAMPIAVFVLMLGLGPLIARLEPNSAMGIRTKATLASTLAWVKVHRLLGRLFPLAGAIGLSALWLEGWPMIAAAVGPALLVLAIGVVYGFAVRG